MNAILIKPRYLYTEVTANYCGRGFSQQHVMRMRTNILVFIERVRSRLLML
jgi:hypothetical protein